MKTTSNYGLIKPDGTDIVDIQNFNDNSDKIDIALKTLNEGSYPTVDATGTNDYVANCSTIKVLNKSTKLTLFVSTDATGNCTINLNSFGAKSIKDSFGNVVKNLKTNIPYNLCYNGTDFILQGKGGGGDAQPSDILTGKTATNDSGQIVGTMPNNGQINATLNAGQSKTIPAGYTSGGTVSVNSLASQTDSTATADKILSGETAYVKGTKITGTMKNNGKVEVNLSGSETFIIPSGYHNGTGKVYAYSVASQTEATATANDILEGKTAYVKGAKLTGTIKSYEAITNAISLGNNSESKNFYPRIPSGAYLQNANSGNPEILVPYSTVANTIGLKAEQIVKGNSVLGITGTTVAGTGNAKPEEVLSGRTFTNDSGSATGTMINRGNLTSALSLGYNEENKCLYPRIPMGAYLKDNGYGGPEISVPYDTVVSVIGLKSSQIVKGSTVLGVAGTTVAGSGNANPEEVLSGRTFTNSSGASTGTMVDRGAITTNLNCGQQYTIPQGYHNGSGKVTVNSLSSQTGGNATADTILSGYTAWVNGVNLVGTAGNVGAKVGQSVLEPDTITVVCASTNKYTVPVSNKNVNYIKVPVDRTPSKISVWGLDDGYILYAFYNKDTIVSADTSKYASPELICGYSSTESANYGNVYTVRWYKSQLDDNPLLPIINDGATYRIPIRFKNTPNPSLVFTYIVTY